MSSITRTTHASAKANHSHLQKLGDAPDVSCWKGIPGSYVKMQPANLNDAKVVQHLQTESSSKVEKASALLTGKKTLSPQEMEKKGKQLIEFIASNTSNDPVRFRELHKEDPFLIFHHDSNGMSIIEHALAHCNMEVTQYILECHPQYKERIYELLFSQNCYKHIKKDKRLFILELVHKGYCDINELLACTLVYFANSSCYWANPARLSIGIALCSTGEVDKAKVKELIEIRLNKHGYNIGDLFEKYFNRCTAGKCKLSLQGMNLKEKLKALITFYRNGEKLLWSVQNDKLVEAKTFIETYPELLDFTDGKNRSLMYQGLMNNNLHFCYYLATQFTRFLTSLPDEVSSYLLSKKSTEIQVVLSLLDMELVHPDELILAIFKEKTAWDLNTEEKIAALITLLADKYPIDCKKIKDCLAALNGKTYLPGIGKSLDDLLNYTD